MMIHKITPSVDDNWWLKRLDRLNEPTNQFYVFSIADSMKILLTQQEGWQQF